MTVESDKILRKKGPRRTAGDLILCGFLLLIGFALAGGFYWGKKTGAVVVVSVGGEYRASYPMDHDLQVELEGINGGRNMLCIANGEACIQEASCPDKLCVHMGKISREGQSIVCLPNQVVIEDRDADDLSR